MSDLSTALGRGSKPAEPKQGVRRRQRGLAHGLVEDFGAKIRGQSIQPGDKLPTEAEIMQAYGVSRTVVREALSKLQAAGLVETHHGIGTFVLQPRVEGIFRFEPSDMADPVGLLPVLELRIGLETEAAGLAAHRRSKEHLLAMRRELDDFQRNVARPAGTVAPDCRFHLQIARATGNPFFADIMSYLGTAIIPRTRLTAISGQDPQGEHLSQVNREHEEIYSAIARGDAESSRAAMRIHLANSRERLRLAQQAARTAAQAAAAGRPDGIDPSGDRQIAPGEMHVVR